MKWGLTRREQMPEPIAREFDALAAAVQASVAVEHDEDGRQRIINARWKPAANQSLTTATFTRITLVLPDTRNVPGSLSITTLGQVRIGEKGSYLLTAQLFFDTNVTGRRIASLRVNNGVTAESAVSASAGFVTVQVTDCVYCQPGDLIELYGYQESGGALSVIALSPYTFLRVVRVA